MTGQWKREYQRAKGQPQLWVVEKRAKSAKANLTTIFWRRKVEIHGERLPISNGKEKCISLEVTSLLDVDRAEEGLASFTPTDAALTRGDESLCLTG